MALLNVPRPLPKPAAQLRDYLATGLMAMAKHKKGQAEVDSTEWAGLLKLALEAMQQRGKAELGQKTVLDPLSTQKEVEMLLKQTLL